VLWLTDGGQSTGCGGILQAIFGFFSRFFHRSLGGEKAETMPTWTWKLK